MKKLLLLIHTTLCCRDPFFYPHDEHRYSLSAIGFINDQPLFATLTIDGISYTVKQSQKILGYTVLKIHSNAIIIIDAQGIRHTLMINVV